MVNIYWLDGFNMFQPTPVKKRKKRQLFQLFTLFPCLESHKAFQVNRDRRDGIVDSWSMLFQHTVSEVVIISFSW